MALGAAQRLLADGRDEGRARLPAPADEPPGVVPRRSLVLTRITHLLLLALAGCTEPRGAIALYDSSSKDFFGRPWPSDDRLTGEPGSRRIDLGGFHNPGAAIGSYIDAAAATPLDGFGTQAAVFFRFDAPLDPASLPADPAASLDAAASAFIVDTTPSSPTYGKRTPVRARFAATGGRYIGDNALALLPEPGFPLRERTTYTAVVTDDVLATDGGRVHRDGRWKASFTTSVAGALGIDTKRVAIAATFTTQNATAIMQELREAVYAQAEAPRVADFIFVETDKGGLYDQYEGTFLAPNFQDGAAPYLDSGGRIHREGGVPTVVRTEKLRFALSVPHDQPVPPGGWPIILYAHGTGGSFLSFIKDGSARTAALVSDDANRTIGRFAVIGIDMVNHGPRDPDGNNPDLTFINLRNIVAARDNVQQGAADDFSLLRLVEGIDIAKAPETGAPIRFDRERIYFKGHSHGGLTGPLFLAYEPKVKAAVLSGAGASFILSLLGKKQPVDIPQIVGALVGEDVDPFHPLLAVAQTFLESSDPANYARLLYREPPKGQAPKSIYLSMGLTDNYTPVPTVKALALAMGAQPVNPMIEPIDHLPLASLEWTAAPVEGNVASGGATGVVCEYLVPVRNGKPLYDGHFVVFKDARAIAQSNGFLATHARSGSARLLQSSFP